MSDNDELVSQFMAFTGSADPSQAASYIEMSGGNLETAVGLYMEHQGGGGGGPGGAAGGGGMDDQVRAPDATRSMRLMDDFGGGGGGMMMGGGMMHGGNPYGMHMDPMLDEQLQRSAFADDPPAVADVREAINRSAAALADNQDEESKDEMDDEDYVEADDDEEPEPTRPAANSAARLADMFAPPDHLIYKEGGFEGARTMAKDSKRWLLVNLQRDSEFSCHALNRDVWRDELVENLVREGFILWQTVSTRSLIQGCKKGCFLPLFKNNPQISPLARLHSPPTIHSALSTNPFDAHFNSSDGRYTRRANVCRAIQGLRLSPHWNHRSPHPSSHVEKGRMDSGETHDCRAVCRNRHGLLLTSFT